MEEQKDHVHVESVDKDPLPKEKWRKERLVEFLGGKTPFYVLGLVSLFAITVFLLNQVSFVFEPIGRLIKTILPPVVFAVVLYYVMDPIVDGLQTGLFCKSDFLRKKKLTRVLSIATAYIVFFVAVTVAIVKLIPLISSQAMSLLNDIPTSYDEIQGTINGFVKGTFLENYVEEILSFINDAIQKVVDYFSNNWQDGVRNLSSIFSAVSSTFITLFTGPIIAFFLILDPKKFRRTVMGIIPPKFREDARELIKIGNQQMGDYLKGQVIASLLLGLIYWGVFLLIGLKYATILALSAGILSIIPYIGSFLAFLPGLFIAFQDSNFMVVKFVIAWFAVQLLHGDLVVPRVMGNKLQIHTVTILIVLLVMGDLLGLVGVIFGIPIYALIKMVVVFIFRKFKGRYNRFYGDEGLYQDTDFSEEDYLEKD